MRRARHADAHGLERAIGFLQPRVGHQIQAAFGQRPARIRLEVKLRLQLLLAAADFHLDGANARIVGDGKGAGPPGFALVLFLIELPLGAPFIAVVPAGVLEGDGEDDVAGLQRVRRGKTGLNGIHHRIDLIGDAQFRYGQRRRRREGDPVRDPP